MMRSPAQNPSIIPPLLVVGQGKGKGKGKGRGRGRGRGKEGRVG